ncbi:hypothetical protein BGZ60DRAFT_435430 [Tricladium varicosporioides]|nr:hypothetical protein BGZ60DRAFT_435430 [Hymenoscyphus varicosporioides]
MRTSQFKSFLTALIALFSITTATTINFNDLATGTLVTTQYFVPHGLSFTPSWPILTKTSSPLDQAIRLFDPAHSGDIYPPTEINGRFSLGHRPRYLALSLGVGPFWDSTAPGFATVDIFNGAGVLVENKKVSIPRPGFKRVAFASVEGISRVRVSSDEHNLHWLDDLVFDDVEG